MGKQQEMDRLWGRLLEIGQELSVEQRVCQRERRQTPRYLKLAADERKLKTEYEKVKGLGEQDPLNTKHSEKMMSEKVVGDLMGRNGPDTHHGIGGNKDRSGK